MTATVATRRFAADATLRRFGPAGRLVLGGSPVRLLRLSLAGARVLDRALSDVGVAPSPGTDALLGRLLDAGVLHPSPVDPGALDGPITTQVTVVVPVRDHAAQLRRLLASVRSDPLAPGRIVVVDDGSADGDEVRRAVADELAGSGGGPPVEVVRHGAPGGPAAARNTGAASARSELVAFVDADCTVTPGWLIPLLAHLEHPSVAVAAPRVVAADVATDGDMGDGDMGDGDMGDGDMGDGDMGDGDMGDGDMGDGDMGDGDMGDGDAGAVVAPGSRLLLRYERERSPLDLGGSPARVEPGSRVSYLPSAALVVRRSVFESLGGFDEAMRVGEDVDLVWRAVAAGHRVRYEPASVVRHDVRADLRSWLAQRFAYGTSAAALDRRHPGQVAPVVVSPWSLAVWGLVVAGHPVPALGLGIGTAVRLRARLADLPTGVVLRLVVDGHLGAGRQLARAAVRVWWPALLPAAVVSMRVRRAAIAALLVEVMSFACRPGAGTAPVGRAQGAALAVLDDLAYGTGVWVGCVRQRSLRALAPRSAPG